MRGTWGGKREPKASPTKGELAARAASAAAEAKVLKTQLGRKESDTVQYMAGEHSEEMSKKNLLLEELSRASRAAHDRMKEKTTIAQRAVDAHSVTLQELLTARNVSEGETLRADAAEADLRAMSLELRVERDEVARLKRVVASKISSIKYRDSKLSEAAVAAAEAEEAIAEAELEAKQERREREAESEESAEMLAERLATIRRLAGKTGGRPVVNRNADALAECAPKTADKCGSRMVERMLDAIGHAGGEGAISEDALMMGLVGGGWIECVWESKEIWEMKMAWLEEKKDELRIIWNPNLTLKVKDKLVISYDKVDELRSMISMHRVGKRLVPRPWVINPWTSKRINFPQPIAPRCGVAGWTHLVKSMQQKWGLRMDEAGRVAQRSFLETCASQVRRDQARGLLRPSTLVDPLVCVLGADGTGIGKRSITHVATSIAPSYKDGALATSAPPLPSPPLPPLVGSSHMCVTYTFRGALLTHSLRFW